MYSAKNKKQHFTKVTLSSALCESGSPMPFIQSADCSGYDAPASCDHHTIERTRPVATPTLSRFNNISPLTMLPNYPTSNSQYPPSDVLHYSWKGIPYPMTSPADSSSSIASRFVSRSIFCSDKLHAAICLDSNAYSPSVNNITRRLNTPVLTPPESQTQSTRVLDSFLLSSVQTGCTSRFSNLYLFGSLPSIDNRFMRKTPDHILPYNPNDQSASCSNPLWCLNYGLHIVALPETWNTCLLEESISEQRDTLANLQRFISITCVDACSTLISSSRVLCTAKAPFTVSQDLFWRYTIRPSSSPISLLPFNELVSLFAVESPKNSVIWYFENVPSYTFSDFPTYLAAFPCRMLDWRRPPNCFLERRVKYDTLIEDKKVFPTSTKTFCLTKQLYKWTHKLPFCHKENVVILWASNQNTRARETQDVDQHNDNPRLYNSPPVGTTLRTCHQADGLDPLVHQSKYLPTLLSSSLQDQNNQALEFKKALANL